MALIWHSSNLNIQNYKIIAFNLCIDHVSHSPYNVIEICFVYSVDTNKERNLYRACICFMILIRYCLNQIIQKVALLQLI